MEGGKFLTLAQVQASACQRVSPVGYWRNFLARSSPCQIVLKNFQGGINFPKNVFQIPTTDLLRT